MSDPDLSAVHGPTIQRDVHTAPFFDAAAKDELVLQGCTACGHWLGPSARRCSRCGAVALNWERAAGTATLVTWSIVHSPPHQAFADQVPYATGFVELAEGPWLLGRLVGVDAGQLAVGAHFEVRFVHPGDGESYPVLVPVTP